MRPRVELVTGCPPEEVIAKVRAALKQEDAGVVRGQMGGTHLALNIDEGERHFWSPWLDAHVYEHADGAMIRGRFMPHPSIWTFYILAYSVLVTGGLIAGIYGIMQVITGSGSWGLWIPPLAVLLAGGLFGSAFVGQRLGADQMVVLRDFLERTFADCR